MEWQPIETAPTWEEDVGTINVILCTVGGGVGEAELHPDGWWWANSHGEYWADSMPVSDFLHWMHLPDAPSPVIVSDETLRAIHINSEKARKAQEQAIDAWNNDEIQRAAGLRQTQPIDPR